MEKHIEERLKAVEDQLKQFSEAVDALGHDLKRPVSAVRDGYYEAALTNAGSIIEAMLRDIWAKEKISGKAEAKTIEQLFSVVKEQAGMDRLVVDYVRDIQLVRNRAAHGEQIVIEDCIECLRKLAVVLDWYFKKYIGGQAEPESLSGLENVIPDKVLGGKEHPAKRSLKFFWTILAVGCICIAAAYWGTRNLLQENKGAVSSGTSGVLTVYFEKSAPDAKDYEISPDKLYLPSVKYSKEQLDKIGNRFDGKIRPDENAKAGEFEGSSTFRQIAANYLRNLTTKGDKISLHFSDVELKDALRFFCLIAGINVVVHPAVKGKVSMVREDTWDKLFESIASENNLWGEFYGNVIYVHYPPPGTPKSQEEIQVPFFIPMPTSDERKAKELASSTLKPPSFHEYLPQKKLLYGMAKLKEVKALVITLSGYGLAEDRAPLDLLSLTGDEYKEAGHGPKSPVFIKRPAIWLIKDSEMYTGAPISISLAHLGDPTAFFEMMHKIADVNIVWPPEIKVEEGIDLEECPWDQAWDLFLKINNLDSTFDKEKKEYKVYRAPKAKQSVFMQRMVCNSQRIFDFWKKANLDCVAVESLPDNTIKWTVPSDDSLYIKKISDQLQNYLCLTNDAQKAGKEAN